MWSCDQSLLTLASLWFFIRIWSEKPNFSEGCSWFKFNNFGMTLGMALKFYTSVAKGSELNVSKIWGLIPTFVEVTGFFCPPLILNRVSRIQYLFGICSWAKWKGKVWSLKCFICTEITSSFLKLKLSSIQKLLALLQLLIRK